MELQSDRSLKQKRRQSKTLKQKSDARQTKRFLNWLDGLSTIGSSRVQLGKRLLLVAIL